MMNLEQFKQIFPANNNPEDWFKHFDLLRDYSISTNTQIANFCQQIGHEQNDMTVLTENLNYSAIRLMRVFPRFFKTQEFADTYANNPEMIANRVYQNRMGNGDQTTGDGWKFRGRGVIMLTGKAAYASFQKAYYGDSSILLSSPDNLSQDPRIALGAALWFWRSNRIHLVDDPIEVSVKVNGSVNGLSDRLARFSRAMDVLKH